MTEWDSLAIEECLVRHPLRGRPTLQADQYHAKGKYPVVDQGQALVAGWTDDTSGLIATDLPLVVFGDHTRVFKYVDFPFVRGADGTQLLKPRDGINPLFFYYACRAVDLPSRGYNRHFKSLKAREILLPSPEEQDSIARVLKGIDAVRSLQADELRIAISAKASAMQALFSRGLRGETLKDTAIGPMPESWDLVEMRSVREWLQYGTSVRCSYEPSEFPVLRIPNIEPGRVNPNDLKFGMLSAKEADRYRLKKGDLLFIRTNGVVERLGSCAVYVDEPGGALFASYLIRARLRLGRVNPRFAAYFFESEVGSSFIASRATPAADGKFNLNTGTIDGLLVPLPRTLGEQERIVEVLDAIDQKIDLHRSKRAVLEDLFKTLLHKLVTGEIRVADLDLSALDSRAESEAVA